MKIVVDTNIVFSAILNTNSQFSEIILRPGSNYTFYSTNKLKEEMETHFDKLLKISGYTSEELKRVLWLFYRKIKFINVELIPGEAIQEALFFTEDIDPDDTEFVALTIYLDGKLWSGDKKLEKGMSAKAWHKFITTSELRQTDI